MLQTIEQENLSYEKLKDTIEQQNTLPVWEGIWGGCTAILCQIISTCKSCSGFLLFNWSCWCCCWWSCCCVRSRCIGGLINFLVLVGFFLLTLLAWSKCFDWQRICKINKNYKILEWIHRHSPIFLLLTKNPFYLSTWKYDTFYHS